jgi:hypothetical protein
VAGILLHVTLANEALAGADLPSAVRREIRERMDDYRLGAVLFDLPHFEWVLVNGLRLLLRREIQFGLWGHLLHLRSPTGLCRELIKGARDGADRAMALGALTHLAIDPLFHEEIEGRVMGIADGTKGLNTLHKQIEDQMDLHVHRHLLGHPGVGTSYAREMLDLKPAPSWMARFSEALLAVHGNAPSRRVLSRWLRGVALFGRTQSSRHFPWINTVPDDDPVLREKAIALAEQAVERSREYLGIGLSDMEQTDDGTMPLMEIRERNLVDGGGAYPVIKK